MLTATHTSRGRARGGRRGPLSRWPRWRNPPAPALTATFAKDKRRREGGEQLRGVREEHGKRACMLTSEPAPATADRAGLPFLAPVGATLRAVTSRTNVNGRPKRGSCCLDHPASHT